MYTVLQRTVHWLSQYIKLSRVTDLSEFRVTQLVDTQPAEGPVQLEQLQAVVAEPLTNQETREAGRQEEQRADVSLISQESWIQRLY